MQLAVLNAKQLGRLREALFLLSNVRVTLRGCVANLVVFKTSISVECEEWDVGIVDYESMGNAGGGGRLSG